MRVAIISFNARAGDAIGNLLALKLAFFHERGADVRVFVEDNQRLHPELRRAHRCVIEPALDGPDWQYLVASDLVVVEFGQAYRLLEWLPALARAGKRIVFDYHGVTPPCLWNGPQRQALESGLQQRALAGFADVVIAHSRFAAGELPTTPFPKTDPRRLHLLPHAVDIRRFNPGLPARTLREHLGFGSGPILLFVGRVAPNKNVPLLVETLAGLSDVQPPVHLVVAGDDGDVYQAEAEICRRRAFELGVYDRVHFLGHVTDERLVDLYRSANLFVMPSQHEGFCVPVIEAMASGVPVIAARAGALPETVGNAGITFESGNSEDLGKQIRRLLAVNQPVLGSAGEILRVAFVSFRYGADIVGGAEGSLRTMARALNEAGHQVEVYTTCTVDEANWTNQLPEGATSLDGIVVHRFAMDPHDRPSHLESVRAILEGDGLPSRKQAEEYLHHSIHSSRLIDELHSKIDKLDAIVVGPYLFGLTADVARAFADKTLLVPCFHSEPIARLPVWLECYQSVRGILYHSPEEQELAQVELGLNHPGATCLGTLIADKPASEPNRRGAAAIPGRYLLYCGRYSQQKGLPLLLDFLQRYQAERPGRFTLICMGRGEVDVSGHPWVEDLGFVEESQKRSVMAGAAALVQLSTFESLSLVALEAWMHGSPVIANAGCAPLAGLVRRSGGGKTITDYAEFATTLDDLWEQPDRWRHLGSAGQKYVKRHFGDRATFIQNLEKAVHGLRVPLAELMRRQGLKRAADHDRTHWRDRFGYIVERVLDEPLRPYRVEVEVRARVAERTTRPTSESILIPVGLRNQGTHPIVPFGGERMILSARLASDGSAECPAIETPLPGILIPGQEMTAVMRIPVPAIAGTYRIELRAQSVNSAGNHAAPGYVRLIVADGSATDESCLAEVLAGVQRALLAAERKQDLPLEYLDVSTGFMASAKRWIKQKLLGNFKHAYVDVISRQQSSYNRTILAALEELGEACALLDQARSNSPPSRPKELEREVFELRLRQAELEKEVARLSSLITDGAQVS
jgi:glycosyltransferase involved in cell wall biosynthesis